MCNLEKTDITSAHCRLAAARVHGAISQYWYRVALFPSSSKPYVAEVKGYVTFMDVKTGRPVDIRTLGGGWSKMFDAFTQKSNKTRALREAWEKEHPKAVRGKQSASKI